MLWSDTAEESFLVSSGGVLLAESATFPGLRKVIEAQGYLTVQFGPPGPANRGRLSMAIEEAIEDSLENLGAVAPGVGANASVDASISDQLYRARLIERRGIVLFVPSLEGMCNLEGILDGDDSVALSWWMQATHERPLGMVIESGNRSLRVYPAPVPFETLLREKTYPPPPPPTAPDQAASSEAMDLSEPPPSVSAAEAYAWLDRPRGEKHEEAAFEAEAAPATSAAAPLVVEAPDDRAQADVPLTGHAMLTVVDEPLTVVDEPLTVVDEEDVAESEGTKDAVTTQEEVLEPQTTTATTASLDLHEARTVRIEPSPEILDAVRQVSPEAAAEEPLQDGAPEPSPAPDPAAAQKESETTDPFHRMAQREWPNWMRELASTRGPKPLAVVERMFVSAYTPLREAWIRNISGPEAAPVLKGFADSFEQSYSEAFDALRVRGKRPTMVLDVPEIAQRIGRLHGARSIQLLLVDGMRFDLGLRVQDRLRSLSRGEASLAERLLLWSALPSDTQTQLELIGKGPSGLKEPISAGDTPVVVARGKNAATVRRIKAGHRELFKLDIIEAALADPGKSEAARLDAIADQVSTAMADHFLKLPPRTLVMMFGDHGFLFDRLEHGTSAGRCGGASPEEVLVPAFAWLVGSVH
jgi:hypothetical protein